MVVDTRILVGYKLIFGVLIISAVITEIVVLVNREIFDPANFFSFFTIESNLLAAAVLLLGAAARQRVMSSTAFDLVRGAAALYMVTTGIVFSTLLAGLEDAVLTAVPWDNIVLHYIVPVVMAVDWIVDPPGRPIRFRRAVIWLAYPIAYVVYSLIRGHIVGWYPYPFLDPDTNGYLGVAVVGVGITIVVLALSWVLTFSSTKLPRRETATPRPPRRSIP